MILIKNARVMDPESGFDQVTDILLDGKRIRQIGKVDDVSGIEQVIDASGFICSRKWLLEKQSACQLLGFPD